MLSCGSLAKKRKKTISGNRVCFGDSNAVVFWEIGLVSYLKGYFHLAHQRLLFISGLHYTEEILWSVRIHCAESSMKCYNIHTTYTVVI